MKILILSPLFPPDTAPSALYIKELASRLSSHKISILLYGHLPEIISGVKFFCIDKRKSTISREISLIKKLFYLSRKNDVICIQNGPSIELPSLLVLWLINTPVIIMESDTSALKRTKKHWLFKIIYNLLQKISSVTMSQTEDNWPLTKPLIHPLKDVPDIEIKLYENSWKKHLQKIESILINTHV